MIALEMFLNGVLYKLIPCHSFSLATMVLIALQRNLKHSLWQGVMHGSMTKPD